MSRSYWRSYEKPRQLTEKEVFVMSNRRRLAWIEDGYVCIDAGGTEVYDIRQSDFDDWKKALAWVNHLSRKTWFTTDHLRALLSTINAPFLG
jgi:hypothetical protein